MAPKSPLTGPNAGVWRDDFHPEALGRYMRVLAQVMCRRLVQLGCYLEEIQVTQLLRAPGVSGVMGVLAVLLVSLLAPLSTAAAHDVLTETNPEDGQTLETMPEAIELTFSDTPLAIGSEVLVQDAQGTNWATGEVQIVDNTAQQAISAEAPAGQYTVTWRVVSSDSHPIEGVFRFTAEGPAAAAPATAPAEQPSPATSEEIAPSSPDTAVPQQVGPEDTDEGVSTLFLIILAILAGAFAGIITVVLVVRRRTETINNQ